MLLHRVLLVIAWTAGALAACTRVEVVGAPGSTPIAEGGFGGEAQGGSGSVAGEPAGGDGGSGVRAGGAPGFPEVGLWPTYAASSSQKEAAAVRAAVSTLALGSATLPLHERWDALSGATGTPRAVTWQRLDAMVQPFRERGGKVALCIDIVDRNQRAWPFTGELDAELALPAIRRTVDEVLSRYAGELSLLCFGYQVDRYVNHASEAARALLLGFLAEAVEYASQRVRSLDATAAVGVAVSLDALASTDRVDVDDLRLGDVVVAVYDPLDERDELKPTDSIAAELTDGLSGIAERDETARPLVLFEVGYPSAEAIGSSESAQLAHLSSLVETLSENSAAVAGAFVYGSDDRSAADCEAEAEAFGVAPGTEAESARALTRCSMGLRAENERPKLAWPSALAALSRE